MNPLKFLHVIFYFAMIAFYTLFGAFFAILLRLLFGKGRHSDIIMRLYIRLINLTCGVKITSEGAEKLSADKPYLIAANHQSLFDIPACFEALPGRLRMLAKKELFKIPVFGWGLWATGHVNIDRENRDSAIKSVDDAIDRIHTEKISPVVYPEGTRSPDGTVQKFKKGAFVLAINAGLDIVPVTIIGSWDILPKKSLIVRSGRIHVCIHDPIPTKGLDIKARTELAKETNRIVEERFNRGM